MPRHRLRDAIWGSLHAKLATVPGIWKSDAERLRRFVEAVVQVLRTSVAGEDPPERFGKPHALHRRFRRWSRQGLGDALFERGIPEDGLETVMVDATITKAQRFASGARGGGAEDLGRSRGGLTTKIHVLVDRCGRPLGFLRTPGQAADCRHAETLLEDVAFACLIGDRA
jgi:putative transposase